MSVVYKHPTPPDGWRLLVPERYYRNLERETRCAYTVGALKAMLAQLPDDLPVRSGMLEPGVTVIVWNINDTNAHLGLTESDYEDARCDVCNTVLDLEDDFAVVRDHKIRCQNCDTAQEREKWTKTN